MKVVEISTVCYGGSVGRITVDICRTLKDGGDACLVAYARRSAPEDIESFRFGSQLDMGLHVLSTFFLGEHGFASKAATKRLIEKLKDWDPDVIQLHNIHGFVLQVELLFDYLKKAGKPVVWTLHDCWPYTGHCAFYDFHACEKWQSGCDSCEEHAKTYPYALFRDNGAKNYKRKKEAFTGVDHLRIVTPSHWLKHELALCFLKEYPVCVIPNGVDQTVFRPREDDWKKELGLSDKFVILGVANVWERRKGLDFFLKLSKKLSKEYQIILIGLDKKQQKQLPKGILGLGKTGSIEERARYYAMADVFVYATLEDNFPTTNLEALSCGTPVITFDTGGSPESLTPDCGRVVPKGDLEALLTAIEEERQQPKCPKACLERAKLYEKQSCFRRYIELYREQTADLTTIKGSI